MIEALWAADGVHVAGAAAGGARGRCRHALEQRIGRAYEESIAPGETGSAHAETPPASATS